MSARSEFKRFIGIDLGGGRGKGTAVARLEVRADAGSAANLVVVEAKFRYGHRGTGQVADEPSGADQSFHDDVLVEYLERWVDDETVVAIDAPLTLPPCLRCDATCTGAPRCVEAAVAWMHTHERMFVGRGVRSSARPSFTPYTQRATELLLEAEHLHPRESLGQGTGPLAARAVALRRRMSPRLRLHENLLEVHPRATLVALFGEARERKSRAGAFEVTSAARKEMLATWDSLLSFDYVWPEIVVRHTHVFRAVIGAFTAYLWARERWRGPADLAEAEGPRGAAARDLEVNWLWLRDGWICTPPRALARGGG